MWRKSFGNLALAKKLVASNDEVDANASVHCSYYAVLQYMKYYLATHPTDPISYIEQERSSRADGSHNYIKDQVLERLGQGVLGLRISRDVAYLKKRRVQADYTRSFISVREAKKLLSIAITQCNLLEKETD